MTGQKVTPSIINKLGASNSQAVRASCCRRVSCLLSEVDAIIENEWICVEPQIHSGSTHELLARKLNPFGSRSIQSFLRGFHTRQGFLNRELQGS